MKRLKENKTSKYVVICSEIVATFFGAGLLPKAPGTWGSAIALPVAYGISYWGNTSILATVTVLTFIIGVIVSSVVSQNMCIKDPSKIVIDEVVGQWLTLLMVPPNIILYSCGFLLFRLFDVWKPWPISWADKKVEGGLGIMLDDVFAAIYSGVLLFIGWRIYQI